MMNINTSTNEFEPVRAEVNAAPVEVLTSAETKSDIENDITKIPPETSSTPAIESVKTEEGKVSEIEIKPAKFSVGFPYIPELGGQDIRVAANMAKLNNEELPLAV